VRVVFFGTPEFAVPSLRALVGEGFDVVAVVTQPDAPQGRSRSQLVPPPVKVVAQAEELPVFQPEKPTAGDFLIRLRETRPDIGVVVAYGHILKPELLQLGGVLASWLLPGKVRERVRLPDELDIVHLVELDVHDPPAVLVAELDVPAAVGRFTAKDRSRPADQVGCPPADSEHEHDGPRSP